ncbi:MAG: polysaccharide biosynthesis tyrosine autokinase [Pseudomonadota bacterium]|nr:polysaccharide biosynthesis tyrosine autokinase [Pseudomonadota bacterium]
MNDRSIAPAPRPGGQGDWLDAYTADGGQMVPYQPQPQAKLIDTAAIRGILYRQRWLMAGVVVLALLAGIVLTLLTPPTYKATATVKVEPAGAYILDGQDIDQGFASNQVSSYIETQMRIITSRNLAEVVASENNLGERTDLLGTEIDESRPPNISDEEWLEQKNSMAASILQGSVSTVLPDDSWILDVSYRSGDPVLAAEMANAYADAFVASDTRETVSQNEYAAEYLLEEIDNVRTRLEEAEQASNEYARGAGLIIQPGVGGEEAASGAGGTLTSANLANINQRVANAKAARIEAEQRWRSIQNLPASQLPEVQGNAVLQSLVSERSSKQARLVELRQRYNDQFPEIQNLLTQIGTLDRQIESTSSDVKATVRNDFIVARNQEQALERELAALTGETLQEQDRQVRYSVLEREAQALRDQLKSLLARYNQIKSATNAQTGAIAKIDAASIPGGPVAPSLTQNVGLALVLGIALASGLAVLRETFDDRIRSLEQVEDVLGLPLLGHTPYIEDKDITGDGADPFGALMEAYASIRTTIDFALPRESNILQLTSSQAGEGKSTTAVIIAELFAKMGRKTLLIDADLRRPAVDKLLDIEKPKVGFAEVLLGHTDLKSAVVQGMHENLEILPIGEIPPNPVELLASTQLRDFIDEYRREYSLIIFDSSPVMGLADAPMLSRMCDATVFILEANKVNFGQAKAAIRRLRDVGGNPLGVVLTKYQALKAGQSYGYEYGYYEYGSNRSAD